MTARRARHAAAGAWRRAALSLACGCALGVAAWPQPALAGDADANLIEFDRAMLAGGGQAAADLRRFERGNPVLPGTYNLDIYVNQSWLMRLDVRFAAFSSTASAVPCIDQALLDRMPLVNPDASAAALWARADTCVPLRELVPGTTVTLDLPNLRLDISVPQAYLRRSPRGYVNPALWDAGMPAFLLDYQLNSYRVERDHQVRVDSYLGLRAGLNLGHWRLRHDSAIGWQSGSAGTPALRQVQSIDAYARRALPAWHASLTLGDSFTDAAVFDSFGLRGLQLGSDEQMLPPSLRAYAPVVRGVADGNAKVTVRQNGMRIYETTVAPGPFVIKDLYPTGYGGDLEVTVQQANGLEYRYAVPYAATAQLLRAGSTRYSVAAGQLRAPTLAATPAVAQATLQHGFSNLVTGYGGAQGAAGYAAVLLGGALNTRSGAWALDVTHARSEIPGLPILSGHSLRASYSKLLPETDTSLTVAAYRYSTRGYLSLLDAETARDLARRGLAALQAPPVTPAPTHGLPTTPPGAPWTAAAPLTAQGLLQPRDRFTLTLSQPLGGAGSVHANVASSRYWNQAGRDSQFQLGYSGRILRLAWGVSASHARLPSGAYDNTVYVSASMPLGGDPRSPQAMLNLAHGDAVGNSQQLMLTDSVGEWNQYNWGANAARNNADGATTVGVNGGYRGAHAVWNASLGKGRDYAQASLGLGGAMVVHGGGITFGQPLGDAIAIVHAPGAEGAHLVNAPGARIDAAGFAIVPYLAPYQLDTVQIDPRGLPLGVELDATSASVAPMAGAVVGIDFGSRAARALIARIRLADGSPAPFGAEITTLDGQASGVVGQQGRALLHGITDAGRLRLRWQNPHGEAQTCAFSYAVPKPDRHARSHPQLDVACAAVAATPPPAGKSAP